MSTELKGRPVLRPAGNVALMRHECKDNRGAHARKPTKKPPLSPPFKPTPPPAAAAAKISPPNSQPSTPRNALIKSPLLKPSAPPKLPPSHSPKKLSCSPVITKACPALLHPCLPSLDPPCVHHDSSPAEKTAPCLIDTPLDTTPLTHSYDPDIPLCLDEMSVVSNDNPDVSVASDGMENLGAISKHELRLASGEMENSGATLRAPEHAPVLQSSAELASDHTPPSFLVSSELIYDLDYENDELLSEELDVPAQHCCGALPPSCIAEPPTTATESLDTQEKQKCTSTTSSNRSTSSIKSPVAAQRKPKSCFTRSSSDNFRRGSAHGGKASNSGKNINCLGSSHSLDEASLACLVAAKKAAAMESSAQRKLKVAEYGRKPGKASRVAPEAPSLSPVIAEPPRCKFITAQSDPLHVAYHDQEWGTPLHDDRGLFELLVLAGAQVELSWTTILHRREAYRDAFRGYNPESVALFSERHIQSLEADKALALPAGKIRGVVENARRILEVVKEFGSLDSYLWSFVNNKPMINNYRYAKQVPAKTSKSEFISKVLVKRGFRLVGPTIVYSFMQAAGMTNDHLVQCFRHQACMKQPNSLLEEAELEKQYVLAGGDNTASIQGDANGATAIQLFCKHDTLAEPQGQQFVFPQAVHV